MPRDSIDGYLIEDCVDLLSTLVDVRVVYIIRTANCVAHSLVGTARSNSGLHVWGFNPQIVLLMFLL